MQHQAHNALVPFSNPGRLSILATTGENIGMGVLVKNSPVFNEPSIMIGNSPTQYTIIRRDADWYNMIFANADKNIASGLYHQTTDLGCIFNVNNQCDVLFDLSFDFKLSPNIKYSYNPTYALYYDTNFNIPNIILFNEDQIVIDQQNTGFRSITPTSISYNKTLNLSPGIYSLVFAWNVPYNGNLGIVALSYKNMKFNILTENVNNVTVTKNTWDIHRMLDNQSLYQNDYLRPDNIGIKTAARVVNSVSTTKRFNNVRM